MKGVICLIACILLAFVPTLMFNPVIIAIGVCSCFIVEGIDSLEKEIRKLK